MGPDHDAEAIASMASELADSRGEAAVTEIIVVRAVDLIPDATDVSLTVKTRESFATLAASSDLASECDEAQYRLSEGPCVETTIDGDMLRSGDVARDTRWPRWAPFAAHRGVGSLLSIRLLSHGQSFGALNLYSPRTGGFAEQDHVDLALIFTAHAASALTSARLVSNLETAMSSRHDIGIAQGLLMGKYGLSSEEAFETLRRISQDDNVKLRDLAAEVMRVRRLPGSEVQDQDHR